MSSDPILDFERPLVELERKLREMQTLSDSSQIDMTNEIKSLQTRLAKLQEEIYKKLTRWQRILIARHPKRPYTLDYVERIATDFHELHGDRGFADDTALVTGLVTIEGRRMVLIGHQKGHDTKENIRRNFGMANPEGYRKALRVMRLADKFRLPVLVLIDTIGAFPGIGAEERGQAEAIANNIREMSRLTVPILVIIIGEGASGGALAIGIGDRVLMMENAWYSVISPEGCAAILWRDRARAQEAAEALRTSAKDLMELGLIDAIIPEPPGGAHRDPAEAAVALKAAIITEMDELAKLSVTELMARRLEKYRNMGTYKEISE